MSGSIGTNPLVINGYPGQVWNSALAALNYYNNNVNASNIPQAQFLTANAANSIKNAINLIDANLDMQNIYNAYLLLTEAYAVPIMIDATDATYISNRLAGMLLFSENQSQFQLALPLLPSSNIPDPAYLNYILGFIGESAPSGISPSTFITYATAAANAWGVLANALLTSGYAYSGTAYQMVLNIQESALAVVQNLVSAAMIPQNNLTQAWNNLVAVPTYLTLSALIGNAPAQAQSQNINTAKYVLGTSLQTLNQTIVALREQITGSIQTTIVRQNENLMDVAARTLGNFEMWQQIATLNNLQPPYITAVATATTTAPGQQIFLPTSGNVQVNGSVPNYQLNYLGVDLYYGLLNQPMTAWTGDFNTIAGYNNLSFSLGRRLQTTLGSLVYHTEFGSRIPPLVGSITTGNELTVISSYATSALLSDPRVNSVVSVNTTAYQNYAINVAATVIPNGQNGSSSVNVNEVVGAAA